MSASVDQQVDSLANDLVERFIGLSSDVPLVTMCYLMERIILSVHGAKCSHPPEVVALLKSLERFATNLVAARDARDAQRTSLRES